MTDHEFEEVLAQWRPAAPPRRLRDQVLRRRRPLWPWLAATAALLAVVVGASRVTARWTSDLAGPDAPHDVGELLAREVEASADELARLAADWRVAEAAARARGGDPLLQEAP